MYGANMSDVQLQLIVELVDIDEKFIRGDLSAAERAILTGQRTEIMQELTAQNETLSQFATASKKAIRRGKKKQATTSKERWEILGSRLLYKIIRTTLDSDRELDALAQLPEVDREKLASRAAAGEPVSAERQVASVVWSGLRRTFAAVVARLVVLQTWIASRIVCENDDEMSN